MVEISSAIKYNLYLKLKADAMDNLLNTQAV